ncbi:hypothetical protein [Bradyrhizobium sp. URHD0069]|uniref:hypothetical protein n=1 Tax=Bradyrhizobium sp. URHD0069 TaxID=1380355 RepID=UPI001FD90F90|nr:hypothetical protein [Bradyrhizobium sp. URHD0069]
MTGNHGDARVFGIAHRRASAIRPITGPCGAVQQGSENVIRRRVNHRGWQREFDDPIPLPDGRMLLTLHDAATYITNLPKKEWALPKWQAAIEALMLVADLGGPTMFARNGMMRALNRYHVREFDPSRKEHHWGGGESSRETNDGLGLRRHQQAGRRPRAPKGLCERGRC